VRDRVPSPSNNARLMCCARILSAVVLTLLAACAVPPGATPVLCTSRGNEALKPSTFASIHLGMTRAQVERILGKEKYSPIDGQDYYSTEGECEVEPGIMGSCVFVIEYRDVATSSRDTGRVTGCFWGGVGE